MRSSGTIPGEAKAAPAKSNLILNDRVVFFISLILATVFPIAFNLLFNGGDSKSIDHIFSLLFIMSTMHVALTGFFFYDKEYRTHMLGQWKFYFLFPITLIVGSGIVTGIYGKIGENYIWILYHAWLLWHYGRQNLGILAFTSIVTKSGKLMLSERLSLNLAPLGAIIAAYATTNHIDGTIFSPFKELTETLGLYVYLLSLVFTCLAVVNHIRNRRHILRILFTATLPLFFVTTFIFKSYSEAIMGYAIAHGIQYFIFMYFLAGGSKGSSQSNILILALIAVIGWSVILFTRESSWWGVLSGFAPGAATAIIMWHFIIDSGLWKLRKKWQQDQVRKRFDFLFR